MKDYPECHSCKEFPRVITDRHCVTCDFQVGCDNFLVKPVQYDNSFEPLPPCYGQQQTPQERAENCCDSCPFDAGCRAKTGAPIPNTVEVSHKASDEQFGGDHYKKMKIQVWDVVDTWPRADRIAYYRGNALKYIMRLNDKDAPIINAEKAAHYCRKLAEVLSEA